MPINPLWIEFYGLYIAIFAAVIGFVTSVCLKHAASIQRFALVYSWIFQSIGLLMFVVWWLETDSWYGHYEGPPAVFFTSIAFWILGIVSGIAAAILKMIQRQERAAGSTNILLDMGWIPLSIILLLSGSLLWGATQNIPKAMRKIRLSHLKLLEERDTAALPQILEGLKDNDSRISSEACSMLIKLGPSAKAALPDLIRFVRERSDDVFLVSDGIYALGVIGAGNEEVISELMEIASRETTNYYLRHEIISALERMGPSGGKACAALIRQAPDLDARQLNRSIAGLKSEDLNVVQQAADSLYYMGSYAESALPLLKKRLDDLEKLPNSGDRYSELWRVRLAITRSIARITP